MNIYHAILLGIVQGLTEFLPISSSAHLYLTPYFFGWGYQGLGFDVALHWGTLTAVVAIFGRDYFKYAKAFFKSFKHLKTMDVDMRMSWLLIVGTLPAAAIGFALRHQAETMFRSPWIIAVTLALFGILLWFADRRVKSIEIHDEVTWKKVLLVGFAQALAIVPGVSRSGATITAGLFANLSRQMAVEFSFLLSGPIIFGAGLASLGELERVDSVLMAGFIASAVSGFLTIKWLMKYVSTKNFNPFSIYRLLLAAVIVATLIL